MTEKEIRQALDDIADVRQSIRTNMKIMKPILLDRAFALFSLVFSVIIAGILVGMHVAVRAYGSLGDAPGAVRLFILATFVLVAVVGGFIKQRIISRSLKKQDRTLTVFDLFRFPEFRNLYGLAAYGALILAETICWFCVRGEADWWVILPAIALFIGFIIALFSLVYQVPEYRILSVISVAFGFIALVFMKGSELLWTAAYSFVFLAGYSLIVFLARDNRITRE